MNARWELTAGRADPWPAPRASPPRRAGRDVQVALSRPCGPGRDELPALSPPRRPGRDEGPDILLEIHPPTTQEPLGEPPSAYAKAAHAGPDSSHAIGDALPAPARHHCRAVAPAGRYRTGLGVLRPRADGALLPFEGGSRLVAARHPCPFTPARDAVWRKAARQPAEGQKAAPPARESRTAALRRRQWGGTIWRR